VRTDEKAHCVAGGNHDVTMSFSGTAFAVPETPGAGNPDTTASGKCPPGQNKDTSTGGLKKCP
jgi:hypothetical protein